MDTVHQMPKWLSLRHLELKSKFIRQFEFLENGKSTCMENVAGGQGLALQQLFPYKSSYSFKNSNCNIF